jgi:hypothetical protein
MAVESRQLTVSHFLCTREFSTKNKMTVVPHPPYFFFCFRCWRYNWNVAILTQSRWSRQNRTRPLRYRVPPLCGTETNLPFYLYAKLCRCYKYLRSCTRDTNTHSWQSLNVSKKNLVKLLSTKFYENLSVVLEFVHAYKQWLTDGRSHFNWLSPVSRTRPEINASNRSSYDAQCHLLWSHSQQPLPCKHFCSGLWAKYEVGRDSMK